MKKSAVMFFFLLISAATHAQEINKAWRQELSNQLQQFLNCENTAVEGANPCNRFLGNALKTVYKTNDFYSKELGRQMLVSEVAHYLKNNNEWTLLGHGYDQKVLLQAQNHANAGKATIAIYMNETGIGHIAMILPGEMKPSGTWGFQVPNSASFFTTSPEKSYIEKGLSYAYERPQIKGVLIYGKK